MLLISWLDNAESRWKRALIILVLPLFGPVAIALATPAYILYVVFVFCKKVKEPSYVSHHLDWLPINLGHSRFAQPADLLKLLEAVLEANIQAIIGINISVLNKSHSF